MQVRALTPLWSCLLPLVCAVLLGGLMGCGDADPSETCRDETCVQPPAAFCDGATRVAFLAFGQCDGGECTYTMSRTDCEDGCDNGICQQPAACLDPCTTPPPPFCEGTVARTPSRPGLCDDGTCTYPSSQRDCSASGQTCRDGVCGSFCGDTWCDDLAPRCEGSVEVVSTFAGCDGATCRYETTQTDCSLDRATCEDGACVPVNPCDGASCETPPSPRCEGAFAVISADTGTCVGPDARCEYPTTRQNCALVPGGFCLAGQCETIDPCEALDCDGTRTAVCEGSIAVANIATGECTEGACVTRETRTDCDAIGRLCREGSCVVTASCTGVSCTTPPAPSCEGTLRVVPRTNGICRDGACEYARSTEDCAATGRTCVAGVCVATNSCELGCDTPPAAVCVDEFLLRDWSAEGTCVSDRCAYPPLTVDCALAGGRCVDGACDFSARCEGVVCGAPPPDRCLGRTAVRYPTPGGCVDGVCRWTPVEEVCPFDTDCVAGRCRSRCEGVVCDTPPSPRCEGAERVAFGVGSCSAGTCTYLEDRVNCAAVPGGACVSGSCVIPDFCERRICETPPPPSCDGTTRVLPQRDGTCADGACAYPVITEDCSTLGQFCFEGACVDTDPCLGIDCSSPPPDACDANVRVTQRSGTCVAGVCDYPTERTDCAATGARCTAGECVDAELCSDIVCPPPPEDTCLDQLAVRRASPRCVAGLCTSDTSVEDCAASGRFCASGVCVDANPCDGVLCNTPPPSRCDGVRVRTSATPGICRNGVCEWTEFEQRDCAADGLTCREGACVPDPCDGVLCNEPPPPICDGTVSILVTTFGTCTDGVCSYDPPDAFDCAEISAPCIDGICSLDPCATVACEPAGSTTCDGDLLLVPGAECVDGACVSISVPQSCPDPDRQVCREGVCVDLCADVICDDLSFCLFPDTASVATSVCERGICRWTFEPQTCDAGSTCSNGACVAGAPCDFVDCDTPPASRCAGEFEPSVLVTFAPGTCNATNGACFYEAIPVICDEATPVCTAATCVAADPPTAGDLRITELLIDADRGADARWIEVFNRTDRALILDGLRIENAAGQTASLPPGVVLPPGAFGVLAASGFALLNEPDAPEAPPQPLPLPGTSAVWIPTAGFSLSPTADSVRLFVGTTLIDTVAWDPAWPRATGRSWSLSGPRMDADEATSGPLGWCLSTPLFNFELRATPFGPNEACPEDFRDATGAELRIDEVQMSFPGAADDAWLELANRTDEPLRLDGMLLAIWLTPDNDGTPDTWVVPGGSVVGPFGRTTIGSSDAAAAGRADVVLAGIVLPPAGGRVGVGRTVDDARASSLRWSERDGWIGEAGRSLERSRTAPNRDTDSETPEDWCGSAQPLGEARGTPGEQNRACPAPLTCEEDTDCIPPRATCEGDQRISWPSVPCRAGRCAYEATENIAACPFETFCLEGACLALVP